MWLKLKHLDEQTDGWTANPSSTLADFVVILQCDIGNEAGWDVMELERLEVRK